jgi:hypothetical protein
MSKNISGIYSAVSGKLGGVVHAKWKGIDYQREYVIPANPKSRGQLDQRGAMSSCVAFAKGIVAIVLNVYFNKNLSGRSAYNRFVSENIAFFKTAPIGYSNVTFGPSEIAPLNGSGLTAVGTDLILTSETVYGGDQLDSDIVLAIAYCETTNTWFSNNGQETRDGAEYIIENVNPITGQKFHCYYIAIREVNGIPTLSSAKFYATYTKS